MLTEPDTHALASVRSCLEDVKQAVRVAQDRLDGGGAVDLTGMDLRMQQLCTQALALPRVQARTTLPDLMALQTTVDALIATLTRRPGQ